jgi:DNA polymerase I
MEEIYLVDGSALIYRSFYAIKDLRTSEGQPTNAVYGFTSTLLKILRDKKPEYMSVLFDLKEPTLRHGIFAEYKAQRKPMPDELVGQLPLIKKITALLGIRHLEKEGYEADDLIATLAEKFKREGYKIVIVTMDKDILQVLDENVVILNPDGWRTFSLNDFIKKYELSPQKIPDILGLAGDLSDNIPGVFGIGEKTAIKLLKTYETVENILENLDAIESEKMRNRLAENREKAILSKGLAVLHKNVNMNTAVENVRISHPDIKELLDTFGKLEFRKLTEYLSDLYPSAAGMSPREDMLTFSTGESVRIEELKANSQKYKGKIEDEKIAKYGFSLKDLITLLAQKGIVFKNPSFDFSIARYLSGKAINENDIFSLMEQYISVLKKLNMEDLFHRVEMPLVKTLAWMEINGIKIDRNILAEISSGLDSEMEILQDKVYQSAGEVFNINSPQQLSSILFEKLNLPVKRKTKTGFSTDTNVLKELAEIHPLPRLIFEYRELFKLKSTYVEGLTSYIDKNTGRIHPNFNQTSTSTGRLSCSNPNLQNIPVRTERGSKIRKAFCCDEGNTLYSFDYNQIELRILAHFSKDPYLINSFKDDRDIHQETADILFSEENSLFSPSVDVFRQSDRRRIAKTINFGILYGMSAYGLAQELNIPVDLADKFINGYFNRFKKVKEYIEKTVFDVGRNGYVSTILKRRRYFPDIQSENKSRREFAVRAAINMPIQGSAADLIKLAMNNIYEYFSREKMNSKMVLQIHDELLFEVYPEEEEKVSAGVRDIMENVLKMDVPLKVDVKRGRNYLDLSNLT